MAAMSSLKDSDTDQFNDDELVATQFDFATHIRHIENVFHFYNVNVHKLTVCTIGDSYNLNIAIADAAEVPYIGNLSHKLNLKAFTMIRNH